LLWLQVTTYLHMDGNNEFLVKRWSDTESNSSTEVEYLRLASTFLLFWDFVLFCCFSGVFCLVGVTPHWDYALVWNTVPLCYPIAQCSFRTYYEAGALTTVLYFILLSSA
jgi:hypothetical protein